MPLKDNISRSLGLLIVIAGWILVIISVFALVKGYDTFSAMEMGMESVGYALGSIIFPLLLTVMGRWVIRKGMAMVRRK